jgi:chromate transporter
VTETGGDSQQEVVEGPARPPSFRALLRYFLGLGAWGFGGPIATVGYMQRDLVEGRRWVDRKDFLNGVALGQTMPGPLAAQVTMWVGYLQRGALGALAVSVAFILPSFLVVLAVAILYVRYQGLDVVQALFYGIAPGVIAVIALAAVKLARLTNTSDRRLWAISAVLATVTAVTGAEIAILFIAAGLLMVVIDAPPRWLGLARGSANSLWLLGAGQGPWIELGGAASTEAALAGFFFKAGAFIFGSGLAIVPFLREGVVHDHQWMTESQFLDAVAMGLITPGPVVISATFIGYYVGGLTGAVVATMAIFIPIYLGVVVPGRWFIRHSNHPQLQAFVKGATAAAAGAIAGAVVVLARDAIIDGRTGAIAAAALVLLWRYKLKEPYIVGLAAVAGLILH